MFKVHCFIKTDGDGLDDISFNLPMMKENGDHIWITTKGLEAHKLQ